MIEQNLRKMATFGVAGNFAGHLKQAGEEAGFAGVKTETADAPKALFPTYIPAAAAPTPAFLGVFPFDPARIVFPRGESRLQIEPECALICEADWAENRVTGLTPRFFAASNDCSIRKEGARKISEKKNWGPASKGLSACWLPVDRFAPGGILDRYRIASFLVRGGVVHDYGEDSPVKGYSYFYERLITWLIEHLNHQQDAGPAEEIGAYLRQAGKPGQLMISVGATRYTDFGEHNFLTDGDQAVVTVYPGDRYRHEQPSQASDCG